MRLGHAGRGARAGVVVQVLVSLLAYLHSSNARVTFAPFLMIEAARSPWASESIASGYRKTGAISHRSVAPT
jgi:hypothetical protein